MRTLRYTQESDESLDANEGFVFAQKFTLALYRRNAIATFIPKNACSGLRYSVAVDNGAIPEGRISWIHKNNRTFNAGLADLARCDYAFAILRCPYRRLVSAYMDKIVDEDYRREGDEPLFAHSLFIPGPMEALLDRLALKTNRWHRRVPYWEKRIRDMSFRDFIHMIAAQPREALNEHWRPQTDFLIFDRYDDLFFVESLAAAAETLKNRIGLDLLDTRKATGHGKDRLEKSGMDAADMKAGRLLEMKRAGRVPSDTSFYDEELRDIVKNYYHDDLTLIADAGGSRHLLFA